MYAVFSAVMSTPARKSLPHFVLLPEVQERIVARPVGPFFASVLENDIPRQLEDVARLAGILAEATEFLRLAVRRVDGPQRPVFIAPDEDFAVRIEGAYRCECERIEADLSWSECWQPS